MVMSERILSKNNSNGARRVLVHFLDLNSEELEKVPVATRDIKAVEWINNQFKTDHVRNISAQLTKLKKYSGYLEFTFTANTRCSVETVCEVISV